jgi:hypothetical protein
LWSALLGAKLVVVLLLLGLLLLRLLLLLHSMVHSLLNICMCCGCALVAPTIGKHLFALGAVMVAFSLLVHVVYLLISQGVQGRFPSKAQQPAPALLGCG